MGVAASEHPTREKPPRWTRPRCIYRCQDTFLWAYLAAELSPTRPRPTLPAPTRSTPHQSAPHPHISGRIARNGPKWKERKKDVSTVFPAVSLAALGIEAKVERRKDKNAHLYPFYTPINTLPLHTLLYIFPSFQRGIEYLVTLVALRFAGWKEGGKKVERTGAQQA